MKLYSFVRILSGMNFITLLCGIGSFRRVGTWAFRCHKQKSRRTSKVRKRIVKNGNILLSCWLTARHLLLACPIPNTHAEQ